MNKICTSLEQSKKLLELGVDVNTADMWWNFYYVTTDNTTPQIIHIDTPWVGSFNWNNEPDNIPCWSLAALLEVIRNNGRYELQMYEGGYYFAANGFMTESYFSPIDACVEMITKLKDLNLL